MIWRTITCTITLFLAFSGTAQDAEIIDDAIGVVEEIPVGEQKYTLRFVRNQYGRSPLNLLFVGYKKLVSDQDNNSCAFHPSCSNYAVESLKKKGLIVGGLNAFDRLSRCHMMATEYYPRHLETRKLDDPVVK